MQSNRVYFGKPLVYGVRLTNKVQTISYEYKKNMGHPFKI